MRDCGKCGKPRTLYQVCAGCTDRMQAQLGESEARCQRFLDARNESVNKQGVLLEKVEKLTLQLDAAHKKIREVMADA